MNCPLCNFNSYKVLYTVKDIPIFQNKVFDSILEARDTITGDVTLSMCNYCSFVFNSDFNASSMIYDENYQNEQAYSVYFEEYLNGIVNLFIERGFINKKIIEIGCGKGYFLEKLARAGFEVTGFDPAYEGDNPRIVKDYFSNAYSHLEADLIILRHTLEHIPNPYDFIKTVVEANSYKGQIYIEVPALEWIIHKNAFWDIFYEHCNYFTLNSQKMIFAKVEHCLLFNDQYQYIIADLSSFKKPARMKEKKIEHGFNEFNEKLNQYSKFVRENSDIAIWGAGAKGATFLNIIDPGQKYIKCAIDINPIKQNRYVGKSAHKIIAPKAINEFDIKTIMVMNQNYLSEILSTVNDEKIKIESL